MPRRAWSDPWASEARSHSPARETMMPHSGSTASALEIRNLKKSFTEPAVDDLSLTIRAGEFYALLDVSICGIDTAQDPIEAKRVLAWVPDEPMIYDKLTPLEYLEFVSGLWSLEPDFAANERCGGFSKGMRQKVALAGALIHEPRLIILDEPLTGLDAGSARQVKSVLTELVAGGVTVIMTTHILEVAERMADRIGIIAKGKLIAEGTLTELRAQASADGLTLEDIFLEVVSGDAGTVSLASSTADTEGAAA